MRRVLMLTVAALVTAGSSACTDPDESIRANDAKGPSETVVRGAGHDAAESTTTGRKAARQPLQVTGQGFTQLPKDSIGSSYVSYAVVVKNPNADAYASNVRVNITLLDAAGGVVASESDTISLVLPGQEAAVAGSTDAAGVAKVDVQVLGEDWEEPEGDFGAFTTEGVATRAEQYGGQKTTGTIVSTFAKNLENVEAVAVYRNAAGNPIGGDFTYVDFVPAGGRIGFEIRGGHAVPGVASTSVYVSLTSLSLLDS